jgi:chemotaxis protein CheC
MTTTEVIPDFGSLGAHQLDAVREVANIGAGHAANALSQMVGSTVMISVPRITLQKVRDMAPMVDEPEEPVAAVLLHMLGDLTGRTLLVFPLDVAKRLAELLLSRPSGSSSELGMLEQSAINEVGNVLSSAYLSALSSFMGMLLIPSPPKLSVDNSRSVITTAHLQFGSEEDYILRVESEFLVNGSNDSLRGFFLLLPDPASLAAMLRAVRVS